jgi:hypothetical protein
MDEILGSLFAFGDRLASLLLVSGAKRGMALRTKTNAKDGLEAVAALKKFGFEAHRPPPQVSTARTSVQI